MAPSRITRRQLVAGAAAAPAFVRQASASPEPSYKAESHVRHRLLAATWQQATNDATILDTTNNTLNSRTLCVAPTTTGVRDIVLAFPEWGLKAIEKPWPGPYVVRAVIEYPAGKFHPVYAQGRRDITVTPGFSTVWCDACPLEIPAGARFYVKCYARWSGGMWLGRSQSCVPALGEWTRRGVDLPDATETTATFWPTALAAGFQPAVFGRLERRQIALGILGASQEMAYGTDCVDPDNGSLFIGRAMRNMFPVMNLSRAGDSLGQYLYRSAARRQLLNGTVTHLMLALGSNDVFAGVPVQKALLWLLRAAEPYLASGIAVYGMTVLPRSISSDSWRTEANQRPVNSRYELARLQYNASMMQGWKAWGFRGMFDCAHAIDPHDRGIWPADNASAGFGGGGFATIDRGAVVAVRPGATFRGGGVGSAYPPNSAVPCAVLNAPGDTSGSGAVAAMHTDRLGRGISFSVEQGGHGYIYPPLIAAKGQWCHNDGVHECKRGYDAVIGGSGLAPTAFT